MFVADHFNAVPACDLDRRTERRRQKVVWQCTDKICWIWWLNEAENRICIDSSVSPGTESWLNCVGIVKIVMYIRNIARVELKLAWTRRATMQGRDAIHNVVEWRVTCSWRRQVPVYGIWAISRLERRAALQWSSSRPRWTASPRHQSWNRVTGPPAQQSWPGRVRSGHGLVPQICC